MDGGWLCFGLNGGLLGGESALVGTAQGTHPALRQCFKDSALLCLIIDVTADSTDPFFRRISSLLMDQFVSILVGGVKHLFGQRAEGLSVEGFVDLFDFRIFMAGTKGHGAVPLIERGNAALADLVGIFHEILWLSAAANAAAGAGHDLHKMVLLSAFLHPPEEGAGIGGAVNHGHLQRQLPNFHLGLPHPIIAPNRAEVKQRLRSALTGEILIGCAQSGLHYPTGVAEDDARTGGLAHQGIVGRILQGVPVNFHSLGPPGQLPRGDDLVGVPYSLHTVVVSGGVQLLPPDFKLFGGAGGQSHMDDLPGVQPHLLGKVGLHRRPLHPDGAFGSGQVRQQFGEINLSEMHPAGTAAGKLGQRPILFRNAADQLAGLLHNGQVCGKVGVQHIVYPQSPE